MASTDTRIAHTHDHHECAECVRIKQVNADLLAALEEVMVWCRSIEDSDSRLPLDYIKQALDAIAKAKGEA